MSCPKCEAGRSSNRRWYWLAGVLLAVLLLALVTYSA